MRKVGLVIDVLSSLAELVMDDARKAWMTCFALHTPEVVTLCQQSTQEPLPPHGDHLQRLSVTEPVLLRTEPCSAELSGCRERS